MIAKELFSIAGLIVLGVIVVLMGGVALAYINEPSGGSERLPVHLSSWHQTTN